MNNRILFARGISMSGFVFKSENVSTGQHEWYFYRGANDVGYPWRTNPVPSSATQTISSPGELVHIDQFEGISVVASSKHIDFLPYEKEANLHYFVYDSTGTKLYKFENATNPAVLIATYDGISIASNYGRLMFFEDATLF